MKAYLIQRWFLLSLLLALAVGILAAEPLQPLSEWRWFRDGVVAVVMFCMSLPLEARAMWRSLWKPGPPLLAVAITYGLLPLVAWAVSPLLRGDLGPGLLVAAATPCTLASAAVWTRKAGGNDAVAILVTLITNASCFLVMPCWIWVLLGARVQSSELGLEKLTIQLALLVVIPILVAQLLRRSSAIAQWATGQKITLSFLSQLGILTMIFVGAIRTGLKLNEQDQSVVMGDLAVMLLAVLGIHTLMLATGVALARAWGFSREDQIAVGFSASQKTLMVGLLVAITLKVSILPMVAYHCLQLFVDTLVADAFVRRGQGK